MSKNTEGIRSIDFDKLRGGYYTPPKIADWMCTWAIRKPKDRILEPSCGDGIFLESASERLLDLGAKSRSIKRQLVGIELHPSETEKARSRLKPILGNFEDDFVHSGDFFAWVFKNRESVFDIVIGNPPFIRYQNFPEPLRFRAMSLMKELGLVPNKLTNIWVPFVAVSTSMLSPGGRLAFILPAELLQVFYAAQLRSFLVDQFEKIDILACNQMIFERAEQEVIILLAEGRRFQADLYNECFIDLIETKSVENILASHLGSLKKRKNQKIVDHGSEKWLKYFLSSKEISFMRKIRSSDVTLELSHYANIDVGVVTGRNEFFVLTRDDIEKLGIEPHTIPLIGRSSQLRGAIIKRKDYNALAKKGERVFLFYVNGEDKLSEAAIKYIKYGEKKGFNKGYKCSIRDPWYLVPSIWRPDFFFFRQIHDFPRIVRNKTNATSTDTIHRLSCKVDCNTFASNFYTHLTAASSEIEGRSYGGGVLELEPTEAERLLMPSKLIKGLALQEIDMLLRDGRLEQVLIENDKKILMDGLGFSQRECKLLRRIWLKMRNRRHSRRKRKYQS